MLCRLQWQQPVQARPCQLQQPCCGLPATISWQRCKHTGYELEGGVCISRTTWWTTGGMPFDQATRQLAQQGRVLQCASPQKSVACACDTAAALVSRRVENQRRELGCLIFNKSYS